MTRLTYYTLDLLNELNVLPADYPYKIVNSEGEIIDHCIDYNTAKILKNNIQTLYKQYDLQDTLEILKSPIKLQK